MMEIIALLLGFLLFCLALLAIPVDLLFYLKKDETLVYRAELCILFGLLTIDMTKQDQKIGKSTSPKKQKREKKPRLPSWVESKRFIKRFMRLIMDLLHTLQIKELSMHWHIGLDDPADTGMMLGILQPILLPWKNATLRADFQEAIFEGYCKAHIRLFPIRIIGYILAFIFSGVTMRMIKNTLIK